MIPSHDKPKRLSLRPMALLFICIASIAILIARGGPWRIAGYVMAALVVVGSFVVRIVARRIAHAREPDPKSTLKI
jgi:hypothetical protein